MTLRASSGSTRSLWMFTTSLLPINWRKLAAIWFNRVSARQNFNAIFSDQNFRGTGWFDAYLLLQTRRASRLFSSASSTRQVARRSSAAAAAAARWGSQAHHVTRQTVRTHVTAAAHEVIHPFNVIVILYFFFFFCAVFLRHCWALKFNQLKCCVQFARFIAAYCVLELSKVSCFKRVEGVVLSVKSLYIGQQEEHSNEAVSWGVTLSQGKLMVQLNWLTCLLLSGHANIKGLPSNIWGVQ